MVTSLPLLSVSISVLPNLASLLTGTLVANRGVISVLSVPGSRPLVPTQWNNKRELISPKTILTEVLVFIENVSFTYDQRGIYRVLPTTNDPHCR